VRLHHSVFTHHAVHRGGRDTERQIEQSVLIEMGCRDLRDLLEPDEELRVPLFAVGLLILTLEDAELRRRQQEVFETRMSPALPSASRSAAEMASPCCSTG
jgi:hypothetical protein